MAMIREEKGPPPHLRRSIIGTCFAVLFLVAGFAACALAQTGPETVRAEVFPIPPLVIEQGEGLTGFAIDLWEAVGKRLKVNTIYQKESSPTDAPLRSKQVDLVVAPVFITVERDRDFDFSYPILEAGQQVMVRDAGEDATSNPLQDLASLLFSRVAVTWLGVAMLLALVPAHIVWLLERRSKDGIIPSRKYFPGILYAVFWSASALLTEAEHIPRQWLARAITLLWMFTGVVFVGLYTAQLTATLTVRQIRGPINGPEDLPGKKVGTMQGAVAGQYLREHNATVVEFPHVEDMYHALLDKRVDALLLGAPVLRYYATREGKGLVKMAGPEFAKGGLGLAFPEGSPLRREVNHALTAMREDGTYQRIYEKWFGSEAQSNNR
jgi:polar amino acid transport system substrate-binding protein